MNINNKKQRYKMQDENVSYIQSTLDGQTDARGIT